GDDKTWTPLFNHKDLSGWKVFPQGTTGWKVENGVLIGSSPVNALFTERGNYQNFHFRVEARINDRGFAAQCFRSKFGAGSPAGYAAYINSTEPSTKTGTLAWSGGGGFSYIEAERDTLVKPDVWFVQEIMVDGNHFTVTVNGEIIVDKI